MDFLTYVLLILLMLVGLFLWVIILLQKGRGGGLAGALGGMGGQSAFGTKAGDTFTWVTYGAAVVWIVVACGAGAVMEYAAAHSKGAGLTEQSKESPVPTADPLKDEDDLPAGDKATGDMSAGDKQASDKTDNGKSAGDKADGDKAAGDKRAGDKATGNKATGDKNDDGKSAVGKAAVGKAAGDNSAGGTPTDDKPGTEDKPGDPASNP
jgi:preprotein translocase subunit SecG